MTETIRGGILDTAKSLTEGDRNKTYGDPKENLECFMNLVVVYLNSSKKRSKAVDGAIIMCLAKISRIAANASHTDNYVDLAAYAAIAGECAGVRIEK